MTLVKVSRNIIKGIPTTITACRALLGVPILILPVQGHWVLAFWLLLVALSTDFLDGLAAKKLHAQTKIGGQLDRLADGSLVVFGFLGLMLSGQLSWQAGITVMFVGFLIGARWFFWPNDPHHKGLRNLASVITLFIAWTLVAWFYATAASGWSWWFVIVTVLIIGISARLKKHRIRAWLYPEK